MPSITVKSEYYDDGQLQQVILAQVSGRMNFPDALDELRVTAKAAFHDAVTELREWTDDVEELNDLAAEFGADIDEEPDGL